MAIKKSHFGLFLVVENDVNVGGKGALILKSSIHWCGPLFLLKISLL